MCIYANDRLSIAQQYAQFPFRIWHFIFSLSFNNTGEINTCTSLFTSTALRRQTQLSRNITRNVLRMHNFVQV